MQYILGQFFQSNLEHFTTEYPILFNVAVKMYFCFSLGFFQSLFHMFPCQFCLLLKVIYIPYIIKIFETFLNVSVLLFIFHIQIVGQSAFYLPLLTLVTFYLPLLTLITFYLPLLTLVMFYLSLLTLVTFYLPLLTLVTFYLPLLTLVTFYLPLLTLVTFC